jgi:ankyrin repeat protein
MDIWTLAREGRNEELKKILEKDPTKDINVKDNYNCTPLHYAARSGKDSTISLLCKSGAQINVKNNDNETPLHIAAFNGMYSVVSLLCELGADVNAKSINNETPLHKAAMNGKETIVSLLFLQGADVNARNNFNQTPLHYATKKGEDVVVSLLVALEADIYAKDISSNTPLQIAVANGKDSTASLLRWHVQHTLEKTRQQIIQNNLKVETLCSTKNLGSEEGIKELIKFMKQGMISLEYAKMNQFRTAIESRYFTHTCIALVGQICRKWKCGVPQTHGFANSGRHFGWFRRWWKCIQNYFG